MECFLLFCQPTQEVSYCTLDGSVTPVEKKRSTPLRIPGVSVQLICAQGKPPSEAPGPTAAGGRYAHFGVPQYAEARVSSGSLSMLFFVFFLCVRFALSFLCVHLFVCFPVCVFCFFLCASVCLFCPVLKRQLSWHRYQFSSESRWASLGLSNKVQQTKYDDSFSLRVCLLGWGFLFEADPCLRHLPRVASQGISLAERNPY